MKARLQSSAGFSDSILVSNTVQGDAMAFAELYNRYFDKVKHRCLSFVYNSMEAEDLAQDVFASVFQKLDGFRGNSSFSTWLYSITVNTCIEQFRRSKKSTYLDLDDLGDFDPQDAEWDEDDALMHEDRKLHLQRAMQNLSAQDRDILNAYYFEEMSVKEIQDTFSLGSASAVKMRLARARKRALNQFSPKV